MIKKTETATRPVRGVPFTRFFGDLNRKKIMLIATAGVAPRLKSFSEPEEGFYTYSKDIQMDDLYLPKRSFGMEDIQSDINCVFPIDRLRELSEDGFIESPTEEHISIYGYHLLQNYVKRLLAPRIAEIVEAADTGAALVLGGCLFCHRIAAVIQRAIEDRGIPTITVSQYPKLSQYYGVSRILYPAGFRAGHAIGPPNYPFIQKQVLMDALNLLPEVSEPVTVVEKEYSDYPFPREKRTYQKFKELFHSPQ